MLSPEGAVIEPLLHLIGAVLEAASYATITGCAPWSCSGRQKLPYSLPLLKVSVRYEPRRTPTTASSLLNRHRHSKALLTRILQSKIFETASSPNNLLKLSGRSDFTAQTFCECIGYAVCLDKDVRSRRQCHSQAQIAYDHPDDGLVKRNPT